MIRLKNNPDFPWVNFYHPGPELIGMTVGYAALALPGMELHPLPIATAREVADQIVRRRNHISSVTNKQALFLTVSGERVEVLELDPSKVELTVIISDDFKNLVFKDCLIVTAAE